MKERDAKKGPGEGLTPPGPLSGQISTMKVAVRPPDLLLIEKVEETLKEVRERGGTVPGGSSLSMRSIDGFIQVRDLDRARISGSSFIRVIEHDPSRGTFLVSGEGNADITTEISWYVLRAIPRINVLFFTPLEEEEDEKEEENEKELPRDRSLRVRRLISTAALFKDSNPVRTMGMSIAGLEGLSGIPDIDMLRDEERDQSRSQ